MSCDKDAVICHVITHCNKMQHTDMIEWCLRTWDEPSVMLQTLM